jgi:LacI family transcriptional regulator
MIPTIKDVAQKANVSTATVSLVLNDNKRISDKTRNKVLRVIRDINYRPSKIARGLVMRQTMNIGFILTDDHFLRTEPFYTYIFLGTEFEARGHKYYILLNTIPSIYNHEDCLPRFVKENNVDGIIIAGKVPYELIKCIEPFYIPLVFIDYYPPVGDHYAVLIDNIEGGIKATDYLISLGHRRIAFIGGDLDHPSIYDRFQGYQNSLKKAKIPLDRNMIIASEKATSRDAGAHAANELFRRQKDITAIFACNDAMALGVLQYARTAGIRIPRDVSLVGFDDIEQGKNAELSLTTLRVPKIEMGSQATKMIVDILEDKVKKPHKVLIPVELIIRDSTAKLNR